MTEPRNYSYMLLAGMDALVRLQGENFTCFASFRSSFYLEVSGRGLICFLKSGLEPGPLNALCSPWPCAADLPTPGEAVLRNGEKLIWRRGEIILSGGKAWRPPMPLHPQSLLPRENLLSFLARHSPQTEFFPLFFHFLNGGELPHTASSLLKAGTAALEPVVDWLADNQCGSPNVAGLLGLGHGLTPSGDDILGGMMLALRLSGSLRKSEILSRTLPELRSNTNMISYAHLGTAACGYGCEVIHVFINSLLNNQKLTEDIAARLDKVGFSSGWDMALGAVLALYPKILPEAAIHPMP